MEVTLPAWAAVLLVLALAGGGTLGGMWAGNTIYERLQRRKEHR